MTQNAEQPQPPEEGARATNLNQHDDAHAVGGQSTTPGSYADVAPRYLALGLGSPLPLPRGRKGPPPKKYTGADAPYLSSADVQTLADDPRYMHGNVGLRLAPGLIGFDVDAYEGKGGDVTTRALIEKLGPLPPTVVSTSRGPGLSGIRLYRVPEGSTATMRDPGPGVEIIRPEHRYAVVSPSLHPSGQQYLWYAETTGDPLVGLPKLDAIPYLPDTWVAHLPAPVSKKAPTTAPVEAPTNIDAAERARLDRYTDAAFAGIGAELAVAAGMPEGGKDEHGRGWEKITADACYRAGSIVRAAWSGLTPEEGYRRLVVVVPAVMQQTKGYTLEQKWEAQWQRGEPAAYPAPQGSILDAAQVVAAPSAVDTQRSASVALPNETDSDATMVDEFAERGLQGRAVYVERTNTWRVYDESIGIWDESTDRTIRETFRQYVLHEHELAAGAGDMDRLKLLTKYTAASKIKAIAELSAGRVKVKPEIFDQHPDLLVVGNGVVDLRTSTLGPFDPDLLMTKRTAVPHLPDATHPDWDEALTAAADDEVRDYLQLAIGQAATGYAASSDVMPICIGGGSNGKSAIFAPLVPVLGHYGQPVTEKVLIAEAKEHSTDLTDLQGLRFALLEELPEESRLNAKRLKDMLGTKAMKARRMRENNITWRPTHSLFVTTNHTPSVSGTDDATWRRLALVRFPWHYVSNPDPSRPEERPEKPRLRDDLEQGHDGRHEAVLAWIVRGAKRWYDGGRVLPKEGDLPLRVVADTAAWRHDQDAILRWFDAEMEVVNDPSSNCSTTDLHTSFVAAMEGDPEHATWSQNKFTTAVLEHPIVKANPRISYNRRATASAHEAHRSKPSGITPSATGERYAAIFGIRFRPKVDQEVANMVVKLAENTS